MINAGAFCFEPCIVFLLFCREGAAIGEDKPDILCGMIRVQANAAAHPAGIIGQDATYHSRVDAGWVRSYFTFILFQISIYHCSGDARLDPHTVSLFLYTDIVPILAKIDQDPICNGLPGQAGPAGAKGKRDLMLMGKTKKGKYLFFLYGLHYSPGT